MADTKCLKQNSSPFMFMLNTGFTVYGFAAFDTIPLSLEEKFLGLISSSVSAHAPLHIVLLFAVYGCPDVVLKALVGTVVASTSVQVISNILRTAHGREGSTHDGTVTTSINRSNVARKTHERRSRIGHAEHRDPVGTTWLIHFLGPLESLPSEIPITIRARNEGGTRKTNIYWSFRLCI